MLPSAHLLLLPLLKRVERHQLPLGFYDKVEFAFTTVFGNGYGHFAHFCRAQLECESLPMPPLMQAFHDFSLAQYQSIDGGKAEFSRTQCKWNKGYALYNELYGCCMFLDYLIKCHENNWTLAVAHSYLKKHLPHVGKLSANELAAIALWTNIQHRREFVTEANIGMAVCHGVKSSWFGGDGKVDTIRRCLRDGGGKQGFNNFGIEQLACNQSRTKPEYNIHVVDQTYTILSPLKDCQDDKGMEVFETKGGKVTKHRYRSEEKDERRWIEDFKTKTTGKQNANFDWWSWKADQKDCLVGFIQNCEEQLWNPFRLNYPNQKQQDQVNDAGGKEAMLKYIDDYSIPLKDILSLTKKLTRKYLSGEKQLSCGYWLLGVEHLTSLELGKNTF